jgi:hypothetical protein
VEAYSYEFTGGDRAPADAAADQLTSEEAAWNRYSGQYPDPTRSADDDELADEEGVVYSGRQRVVAELSYLTRTSHSLRPHHPAATNPPASRRYSITSFGGLIHEYEAA